MNNLNLKLPNRSAFVAAAILVAVIAGVAVEFVPQAFARYSRCSSCSCPGFTGSGKSCSRCGHHYDSHW